MKLGAKDRAALYPVLATIGEDWAHSLIAQSLRRDSGAALTTGILALGSFGRSSDAKTLVDYSNRTATAQAAVQALGRVGGSAVVQRLGRGLESKNPVEKLHCAASLWRLGERDKARPVIEEIVTAASEEAQGFKNELADALLDLDDPETTSLVMGLIREMNASDKYTRLSLLRDRSEPEVLEVMRGTVEAHARGRQTADSWAVAYAIEALVRNAPDEALFDQLSVLMREEGVSPYVRVVAAAGMIAIEKAILPAAGEGA
jgi:hypothetical protein